MRHRRSFIKQSPKLVLPELALPSVVGARDRNVAVRASNASQSSTVVIAPPAPPKQTLKK